MNKINAVKLRTLGETEYLSLPKEVDMATNRMVNDLATFHLQLDKFKSSLNKQFSSFKQSEAVVQRCSVKRVHLKIL